jgi:FdhD protein
MHRIPLLSLDQHALPRTAVRKHILALRHAAACAQPDWLAVEEPLEIRVQGPDQDMVRVAVTMRTPGHDPELAVGFLYAEGLIRSGADLLDVSADRPGQTMRPCNVVTVRLAHAFDPAVLQRHFYATSSCGICGKASLEQIAVHCAPVAPGPVVPRSVLVDLPTTLRSAQPIFEQTGGLHAAGLFDVTGRLILLREDVGRHNAVDKLVGQMVLTGAAPLAEQLLLVSGRTSFEIMQKAAMAQVPIVCGVSAPSSLAVEVAQQFGMTLVGFLRQQGCNVYTHTERIALEDSQRKEGL